MVMKKHILFIVENNSAPQDIRVWSEATAMMDYGYEVTVICPKRKAQKWFERIDGIDIYRHFAPLEADGKLAFLLEYGNAIFWEVLLSLWIFIRYPFKVIHGANPPDQIFLIALLFKILGVKYIFDHHDLCPENYLAKFDRKDVFHSVLKIMEKVTFMTADLVISTNESYKKIATERGGKNSEEVFVVRNGPNLSRIKITAPNNKLKEGFDYLVAYVGVIGSQEGIDNLLAAVKHIVFKRGITNIKFVVIGTGPNWKKMVDLAESMCLTKYIRFTGFIPNEELWETLATADLCVNPEMRNEFTDKSTMIKIMEYMAFGKPIVQFFTQEGAFSAGAAAISVKENVIEIFSEAIIKLLHDPAERKRMGEAGQRRIREELNWDIQKINLKAAYESLLDSKRQQ
jgi:glycosyltransferase involved in cell wall biosynthesis